MIRADFIGPLRQEITKLRAWLSSTRKLQGGKFQSAFVKIESMSSRSLSMRFWPTRLTVTTLLSNCISVA
jgi:hypothetical protein